MIVTLTGCRLSLRPLLALLQVHGVFSSFADNLVKSFWNVKRRKSLLSSQLQVGTSQIEMAALTQITLPVVSFLSFPNNKSSTPSFAHVLKLYAIAICKQQMPRSCTGYGNEMPKTWVKKSRSHQPVMWQLFSSLLIMQVASTIECLQRVF